MAWVKRSAPVESTPVETEETTVSQETNPAENTKLAENTENADTAENAAEETKPEKMSHRYNKAGHRRGQRRGMAILGLFVLIFAVIGMIATVITGVHIVQKARDTSYLKEEMYYTLLPLMQYAPTEFTTANNSEQDTLIQSALYLITNREWIRQQQDSEYASPYTTDEFGRTVVPIEDVKKAYAELYGEDATPYCHTFGDDASSYFTYEYDEENQVYYIPYSSVSSTYEPLIDTIRRAGNIYTVRVGYVHLQDVTIDDYGNRVIDINNATYFQLYSVKKQEDGSFIICSVTNETTAEK